MPVARRLTAAACELLFPRVCAGCGGDSDRPTGHLCWECFRLLPLLAGSCCERCGRPVETPETHVFLCGACRDHLPAFDRARVAGKFQGSLRRLAHAFKYSRALWLTGDLAEIITGCVLTQFETAAVDVVVPVPLFRTRARGRGYNQAALLGEAVARRLDRPFASLALMRVRDTGTQTRLSAVARRLNVRDAFVARETGWVIGRTVLLVDDVMTTGATLSEAARALKAGGAWRVWAVAAARG
jgi:ComF family protein